MPDADNRARCPSCKMFQSDGRWANYDYCADPCHNVAATAATPAHPPATPDPDIIDVLGKISVAMARRGTLAYGGFPLSEIYDIVKAYGDKIRSEAHAR